MSATLDQLHRAANGRGTYEQRKARWEAYRAYARQVTDALSFAWRPVAMDNPTQNHTGTTNGKTHIVVSEPITIGRLRRETGEPLCGKGTANLWGDDHGGGVTCKRCLEVAERQMKG